MTSSIVDQITDVAALMVGGVATLATVRVQHPTQEDWVFVANGRRQVRLHRVETTWVLDEDHERIVLGEARHLYAALGLALCEIAAP